MGLRLLGIKCRAPKTIKLIKIQEAPTKNHPRTKEANTMFHQSGPFNTNSAAQEMPNTKTPITMPI